MHILGASSNGEHFRKYHPGLYKRSADRVVKNERLVRAAPANGEKVALVTRHRHAVSGDEAGKQCYLYHYTVPLDSSKPLTSITLPNNPDMKIMAITFERSSLLSPLPEPVVKK